MLFFPQLRLWLEFLLKSIGCDQMKYILYKTFFVKASFSYFPIYWQISQFLLAYYFTTSF